MGFNIGDRVRTTNDYGTALRKGETGTVIGYDIWNDPMVHWDEFNEERHKYDGEVPDGHGWYILNGWIELIDECRDLGDIARNEIDMRKFLFDT